MPLQKTEGPVYNPNAKKDPSQQVQKDPSQQGQRDPYDVLAKKALQKSAQLPVRSDAPPNAIDPKKETKMDVKDKKSKRVDSKVSSKKKKTGPEERAVPPWSLAGFTISPEEIARFESNPESLKAFGGIKGVANSLRVDPAKGIEGSPADINLRKDAFGPNTYPVKKAKIFLGLATGWYDGGGISFAIVLVVMVSSVSDYQQAQQFRQLSAQKRKILINVTRGSRRMKVSIFDLVVGDIVQLNIGDQIPADGLLIEGHSMLVDESSMTGESEPMAKDEEERPFMLSGCKVMDGFGDMMVTAVGMATEWGKLMATISEDNDELTPLQERLNSLATTVGKVGVSFAVVVFIVLVCRFLAVVDFKNFSGSDGKQFVDYFAIAVTIVVVAVPEGLPLAVTLTLAYSMAKMMDDRALVRHLSACETMGSATAICSDKTGTLTMNLMTVVTNWICGQLRTSTSIDQEVNTQVTEIIFQSVCLNSNGNVFFPKGGGPPEVSGSPTEQAVLSWGVKLGAKFDEVKKSCTVKGVETFNSTKKKMGVCFSTQEGKTYVHWKGAAEIVLDFCSKILQPDGTMIPLDPEKMVELKLIISSFANSALRTLCFAYKELTSEEVAGLTPERIKENGLPEGDLTCIAIVGIKDPCRPGVPEAVARCQAAGIKVRMVTGDNIHTAKAIAIECGILTPNGIAVEGKDFRVMTVEEQCELLPNVDVMARSSPTDKHTLVKRLLEMGEIVAVTGDGTNDAPALHEASIGLAMGIAGTEVAKESSDIIILDDNFASIVKVVRWGRSIYVNIQKFIQFQTTVNGVALLLNFITALASGEAPLTAVQLLWVNLIMDTLGALALATEPPTEILMQRPPIPSTTPLITNVMWRNIVGQTLYQLSMLLVLHFKGYEILGLHDETWNPVTEKTEREEELQTIIFNAFVFCQIFNEINARKPDAMNVFEGLYNNHLFLYVTLFTCIMQALIVEFAGDFASTVGLNWQMWILCVCLGLLSMPFAAAVKLIPVPDEPFHTYLFFWRAQEHHIVLSEGGAITAVLVGQKGNDEGVQYPEGTKFLEAVIGGETVRVPMPTYPSPYPPPTEPFFSRLRYAFFPNTHAKAPSATRAAQVPKPGVAWSDKK
ncbi:calcium-transporting ATPase 8, plasma membrane-type isoform X2 [Physcomitrium patens]|uniref:calcium-transporting ATPase 8, plasma membrane-type isoform X2 n=1 Tax=Physcomitrium patens TaxID=3218 RepID=UPI000D172F77|nr:calcium-transporting ATPase 8, plasma membrane-type-like isoform X2 [Physcomitrium patens]|eukprot:XP_024395320.1 calcium-transporting ATPase 8, plasma membrane-type-like isoform X2 [Physcomitrella patens]